MFSLGTAQTLRHTFRVKERIMQHLAESTNPLIAIVGPTAGGKTALSLRIAKVLASQGKQAEVVNADSRQFYRSLSIGTAKVTPWEQENVPHHMIDILEPNEELTAAQYRQEAEQIINEILERGNVPMLVGGSMLYVSAVTDGLVFAGRSDPALRKELEHSYDLDGGASLYAKLLEKDPTTAKRFSVKNKPYVVRAVEILQTTGELPSLHKKKDPQFDVLFFGIAPERDALVQRIADRINSMFADGWEEEVRTLMEQGYTENDPGMKSLGYREIMQYLKNPSRDRAELQEVIASKTRKYAKRQMTWWRGDERISWVTP